MAVGQALRTVPGVAAVVALTLALGGCGKGEGTDKSTPAAEKGASKTAPDKAEPKEAEAKKAEPAFDPKSIVGIGVDTTGSTPLPVDKKGTPLAMLDECKGNPNAHAWLWKDHTGYAEAAEITDALIDKIASQSDAQSGHLSIRELERKRDGNLIAMMRALKQQGHAAGRLILEHQAALRPAPEMTCPMVSARRVIPIDCRAIILQHGSLHCLTMQFPRALAVQTPNASCQ